MIIENVHRNKLHQELVDAGIDCIVVAINATEIGANIKFDVDTDMGLVQQIVDAHNPTPTPAAPSETEVLTNYLLDVDMRLVMVEMGLL